MYDEFIDWVSSVIGPTYTMSRGMWIDSPSAAGLFIASVHGTGGLGVDVDDRRPRFRVVLLGRRETRSDVVSVGNSIQLLVQSAIDGTVPCGAATIRAIGEPIGAGYTEENRPWYSVDFEVVF